MPLHCSFAVDIYFLSLVLGFYSNDPGCADVHYIEKDHLHRWPFHGIYMIDSQYLIKKNKIVPKIILCQNIMSADDLVTL